MLGFSYRVLLVSLLFISPLAISAKSDVSCQELFDSILKQEPYLAKELEDLQLMCEQDIKANKLTYWSCVNERMQQGPMSFERFILSDQVCHEQSNVTQN